MTVRTALICVALVLWATALQRFDEPALSSPEGEKLCRNFARWQAIMRKEGYPRSAYAETGMERFCPNME